MIEIAQMPEFTIASIHRLCIRSFVSPISFVILGSFRLSDFNMMSGTSLSLETSYERRLQRFVRQFSSHDNITFIGRAIRPWDHSDRVE